ncbi:MAG: arginine--tRNA ligase [Thermaerobacter sp.]|nr:arginine--tRNA ligase [Thermaerobacter sp.]
MGFSRQLRGIVEDAYLRAAQAEGWPGDVPDFAVERPKDTKMGDYATNIALQLARPLRRAPREIAERIAREVHAGEDFAAAEVAGAGFLNFRLTQAFHPRVLRALQDDSQGYLSSDIGRGERILLEFVSANPTGPLNVVSARAAAIGDTLGRLLRLTGHDVFTEYYVNDAGSQVENLALSILVRMQLPDGPREIPEDGYHGEYVTDLAKRFLSQAPASFSGMPREQQLSLLKAWAMAEMGRMRLATLEAYGVHFDNFFSEAAFRAGSGVDELLATFARRGILEGKEPGRRVVERAQHEEATPLLEDRDGARWLRTDLLGDDKDRVLVRSDGNYTYFLPDIGYHHGKYQRGYTRVIDLLGPDHHGYVARMRAAMEALGHAPESFQVLIVQWVRFLRGGVPQNMSKRAGETVTIDELLSDVGRDAARYFFLMRSHDTPLDFDLQLAQEESSENPVYYVQYAHARIASIRRQAGGEASTGGLSSAGADFSLLTAPEEVEILRRLGQLPEEIEEAAKALEPHRIPRMATELAQAFHSFYNKNRVLGVDPPLSAARLALAVAVGSALRELLTLLGVDAPDRM